MKIFHIQIGNILSCVPQGFGLYYLIIVSSLKVLPSIGIKVYAVDTNSFVPACISNVIPPSL